MSGILGIALSGLNSAAANFAQAASNIVNASSTGGGSGSGDGVITDNLVALQADTVSYQADIAVAKVAENLNQRLIDVLV